jgi:hypothetical protein
MSTEVIFRSGSTAERMAMTPARGEIGSDNDTKQVILGDGVTAGGIPMARADEVTDALTKRLRLDAAQENTSVQKRQGRENLSASHHMRFVQGLTLSNGPTSLVNIVDIAPGAAQNSAGLHVSNTAVLSKNLTGAWAPGNGGGMDTGVRTANRTYHVHAIRKQIDGTFDAVFSLSATAPVVPAGYDLIERVGAIVTDSGDAIRQFVQHGNRVALNGAYSAEFSIQTSLAKHLFQFSPTVPVGVPVLVRVRLLTVSGQFGGGSILFWDGGIDSAAAPPGTVLNFSTNDAGFNTQINGEVRTDSNGRAYLSTGVSNGATIGVDTSGWTDFTIPRIGA